MGKYSYHTSIDLIVEKNNIKLEEKTKTPSNKNRKIIVHTF